MKRFIFIGAFIIVWMCTASNCAMDYDETLHLYLINNSDQEVKHLNYFSDTVMPVTDRTSFRTKALSGKDVAVGSKTWELTYEKDFPSDTMHFFILSSDTLDKYGWEQVQGDYNILVRYDLSLQDLYTLNFRIVYPPNEVMSNIKMYPSYVYP